MSEEIRGAVELIEIEEVEKLASYYGSKRKWAKLIVDKFFPEGTKTVLDPTAGMGWVPIEALKRGMSVYLNEASPAAFTWVRGLLKGEPLDVEKFSDITPTEGRMSKGDIYGTAPREVVRHLDSLAIKAKRMDGPRGFWAQALVANILFWGSGGHLGTWTAYDDPRWKPAMTWKGTREILGRAHEAMAKLKGELKGKSVLTHGDVRDFKWHDVDLVFLDPPYFGSGMTDYSRQYKNINCVLLQSDEPVRFKDLTEDDFFNLILPKAIKHSKRVVLCYPAKRSIGRKLGKLGLAFRSAALPKKLTGATISSNRAEGGTLDSNTRVYIIDGARKAGVKKASTRAWLLGTLGEPIPINEGDPQAMEAAKLGSNYPHRAASSLLIDDGRARILVDLGAELAHELDSIKPDAVIVTRGSGLAGLIGYKDSGIGAIVFVPDFVKHENIVPKDKLRIYEAGDKIRIPDLPDIMTFDTGDGIGIHYKELVYTPNIKSLNFDAHLKQHGEGGGGTVWIADGLGLGPHRGKTGEPRVKGHPILKEIIETATKTGVRRVVLTNIGRHGLASDDFKSRIRDLSRDSGISVTVGEDELDLREARLSSEGESLFVKDAYNPRRVNDAQLSDDFRLVAAKYSTLKDGGATEFEDEGELLDFAEGVVRELLRRDKVTFHFKTMKPRSRELIRKVLRRIIMTGVQFSGEDAKTLASGKPVGYFRKDGIAFDGFNYIVSADNKLAYGFIRFHPPKKTGDEYSYEVRDLIPFDEPISVDLRGVKKNATVEVSLRDDGYDESYYAGMTELDAGYIAELGAILAEATGDDYLDLGCGAGRAVRVLVESGYKALGIDKSKTAVKVCEELGLPVQLGDAEKLSELPDGSFDTVFSSHLLEHVSDPEAVLSESIRLARKRAIHLIPLGKRQDKTHQRSFMSLDDVRALVEGIYGSKTIRRGPNNTALVIINRETAQQGRVLDLLDDLVVIPEYVSLAGSWVKSEIAEAEENLPDVDLVIRAKDKDEGMELKLRNQLPKHLQSFAHFIYNEKGPHDDHVPVYDLALIRRKPERCDIEKRTLKPLTVFKPVKMSRGYTLLGTPDLDIFYEGWAKAHIDEGTPLDVEIKYNGWRTIGEADNRGGTLIYFEDSKKDRSNQFQDLRDELRSIGEDVILDLDLGAITDEGKIMARKDLAWWGGRDKVEREFKTPGGQEGRLVAHVFDILYYNGEDLHTRPWTERREILEKLFAKHDFKIMKLSGIRVVKKKSDLYDAINRAANVEGSEGAVIKVTTSDYSLSGLTTAWSKVKNVSELKVVVLDRVPVKGSASTWNYIVGYQADGETLKLGKTFNTKLDAKTGAIITISAEEVIPKYNEGKKRWEVSVVVPRVEDIESGRSAPDKAEDIIRRANKAGVLQLTDETRDRLKKDGLVTKALREGGLSFEEGQTGEGVVQTHERGLSKDQVEFTRDLGWEPTRPTESEFKILGEITPGDWRGAVDEAAEGKSGKLKALLDKVEELKRNDADNLTRGHRKALAQVDLVSVHTDFRLRPGKEAWWEGGEFFTPGNQFSVNKIKAIADGDLPETTKVLGNFKVGREDEGGSPVKVKGQEIVRGPISWLKIGERSPAVFPPGETGASSDAYGRMTVRDKIKWTAGIQDKHFKEFWLDGSTIKGRWIFQFVPVTQLEGAKRAWMASRPKDQRMKSEKAREMIGQD